MKDIDFDELDRAVGSVLGTAGTSGADKPAAPAAVQTAPVITPVAPTTVTPQPHVLLGATPEAPTADEPDPSANDTPKIVPVAPARRRGQFLDMVHPSADMRNKAPLPIGIRKTLAPLAPIATSDVIPPSDVQPTPDERTVNDDVIENNTDTSQSSPVLSSMPATAEPYENIDINDGVLAAEGEEAPAWPDPIDVADEPASDTAQSEKPKEADQPFMDLGDDTEPAQTPFVADARVDKRPLGAFADTDTTNASTDEEAPELASDINSVEATGIVQNHTSEAPAAEPRELPTRSATPKNESAESIDVNPSTTPDSGIRPTLAPPQPATSGLNQSISQQYRTPAPHTDDTAHPLFDTEEYHQPLLADGKKKSHKGLFAVALSLVLLAVGGALGYLAYTMGL